MDESMDMDVDRTPSPEPSSRSMEIHLGQEIITIDLGSSLDPNPDTVLEVLLEGQCKVWYWTKLAGEYWRRGLFDSAEKLAKEGVECNAFRLFCHR
jgi:RNA polymerase-associated protein CTR9